MPDTSTTLDVDLGARGYPIHVGHGLLDRAPALLGPCLEGRRVFMLTDSGLAATPHPDRLARALASAGIEARRVEVPAGEASKGLPTLGRVLDLMIEGGLERGGVLVTLGGGVVGDLGGFAAAVALRGIDYIQVPTTLLAQVDSAVGGKTGVNSRFGKNLIGAFHQPKAVLVDLAVLDTLPARELRAGYAEVLKYGCIRDAAFFAWLEANGERVLALEPDTLRHAVRRSIEIKAAIVAAD
ncbi:MAG: iron-containing alcohol dehydrogenase, partial [Geminicoccaceae bacterium]|nr:iron-containing alcohol dehydrogenase [Geminicoccaceae bacterium]